jgi:hypothetical protein
MRPHTDLLHEALRIGDANGATQFRRRRLPEGVMTELVRQTHEHALANAAGDAVGGWLTFRGESSMVARRRKPDQRRVRPSIPRDASLAWWVKSLRIWLVFTDRAVQMAKSVVVIDVGPSWELATLSVCH